MGNFIINYKQFPYLDSIKLDNEFYGLEDVSYRQLYVFNKEREVSPVSIYIVDIDEGVPLASVVNSDMIDFFKEFGVYFKSGDVSFSSTLSTATRRLLIIPKEVIYDTDKLQKFLEYKRPMIEQEYTDVVVEENFGDNVYYQSLILTIKSYVKSILGKELYYLQDKLEIASIEEDEFFVSDLSSIKNSNGQPLFNLVCLNDLFLKYKIHSSSYNMSINNMCGIIDELSNRKYNAVDVYYLDFSSITDIQYKNKLKFIYPVIAAYLNYTTQMNFEINPDLMSTYFDCLSKLASPAYNTMYNYLKFISNPLELGLLVMQGSGYVTVLDDTKLFNLETQQRNWEQYSIELRCIGMEYDLNSRRIIGTDVINKIVSLHKIEALDLNDIYNLDVEDNSQALKNLEEVNKLVSEFEYKLKRNVKQNVVIGDLINCSNLLLFKEQGRCFLMYVGDVSGKYPYKILPLTSKYKLFKLELDIKELTRIYSLSILTNHYVIRKKLNLLNKSYRYSLPSYSKGIVLTSLPTISNSIIEKDSSLSITQIGVWSAQCAEFRGSVGKEVIRNISPQSLRAVNGLTYYGGPHPSFTVNVTLNANTWRESYVQNRYS